MAKPTERVSVFTRNHRRFLDEAVARNSVRPERFTTFRSSKRWAGAHAANVEHGTLTIFLAAIGGDNVVEYSANLHQVHLEPDPNDEVTKEVLASELEETRKEGLWEDSGLKVKTTATAIVSSVNWIPLSRTSRFIQTKSRNRIAASKAQREESP